MFSTGTKPEDNPLLHGRLAHGLGPGVRRAAPEIYTPCIAVGAHRFRDWVEMNLSSSKGTDAWTEIWDRAAQIDFAVAQCRTDQELMSKLAMDDTLEMHLRRLVFIKFRMRTGDKSAAAQMLAFHAPGSSADIAPSWLVADVTQHSKTEHWHQRVERLSSAAKHVARGGGDSSGGKGRGTHGGGQYVVPTDNSRGRGRGQDSKGRGKDKGRGRGQQVPPYTTHG